MAFTAAMTGHQVYTTLHTNSAIGSVSRLLDIGIVPDIMAGNIIGIIAQRLVRRLCAHCKASAMADEVERRLIGLGADDPPVSVCRAVGCEQCHHQGYKGRMAIMELLKVGPDLDEAIARRASARELRNTAHAAGFRSLVDDGMRRVLQGITSLDEVARVIDLTERLA
jgi:general secretion pathway protein E/type IV pilus assembly protein PilB